MEAPLNLRRPANWQDFESLCKKLWGEIWECPEIQKNGRLGQDQSGVDVFGMPFGEKGYYGIQCKGKSEYLNSQFTEVEILEEIEKAKKFEPKLKKYYLATTAVSDSKIQAFVRKKNVEHIELGLFEVHLFCWESIVELIDENRQTHDWYVKNQNFRSKKSVTLTFDNNEKEIYINPIYRKEKRFKRGKISQDENPYYANSLPSLIGKRYEGLSQLSFASSMYQTQTNLSYSKVNLVISNTGEESLEEFKVSFSIEDEILDLSDTNRVGKSLLLSLVHNKTDIALHPESQSGKIFPFRNILVGEDNYVSDEFFIKAKAINHTLKLNWKLISKDFKEQGTLLIHVVPEIRETMRTIEVVGLEEPVVEIGEIEDYLQEDE